MEARFGHVGRERELLGVRLVQDREGWGQGLCSGRPAALLGKAGEENVYMFGVLRG